MLLDVFKLLLDDFAFLLAEMRTELRELCAEKDCLGRPLDVPGR